MKPKGLLFVMLQAFPLKVDSNSVYFVNSVYKDELCGAQKSRESLSLLCYLEKNGYAGKRCFFKVFIKVSFAADYFPSSEKHRFTDKLPKSTQCSEMTWLS